MKLNKKQRVAIGLATAWWLARARAPGDILVYQIGARRFIFGQVTARRMGSI